MFTAITDKYIKNFRVILIDFLGHGKSERLQKFPADLWFYEAEAVWGGNVIDIQHVGSAAIYNIPAKPILDAAVRLNSIQSMDVEALIKLGYDYCGPQCDRNTNHLYVLHGENQISLRHIHCYDINDNEFFNGVDFEII